MRIQRSGSQPSATAPSEHFTGTARIDAPFAVSAPSTLRGSTVTFEPGARTAWHRHPVGQVLIVIAGAGLVQREGGAVEAIHPGDIVLIDPDERHWHGAAPTTAMTHIAFVEAMDGPGVSWMEKVTDAQYGASATGTSEPSA